MPMNAMTEPAMKVPKEPPSWIALLETGLRLRVALVTLLR